MYPVGYASGFDFLDDGTGDPIRYNGNPCIQIKVDSKLDQPLQRNSRINAAYIGVTGGTIVVFGDCFFLDPVYENQVQVRLVL